MTWWSAILATVVPSIIAGGIALLTWRSLRHQQTATAIHEISQAYNLDSSTFAELRRQVDELWQDRNRIRGELDRARERITLLEREVARLGGNPLLVGVEP